MAEFDLVVIGGGTGNNVAAAAADAGLETALVEPGPLGGTCLNRGCNPSKMLIQAANAANHVREADRFHVEATLDGIDTAAVVDEMDDLLGGLAEGMAANYREKSNLTLFEEYTEFLDDRGFIETNEYLETTADNVWAQGDVAGNALFKHSGDYETRLTVANAVHGERRAVDFSAMPHTIFTEPQIAGVGSTEEQLQEADTDYRVGRATVSESAMGRAKKLDEGFVKVLAATDGELLGCHIIGHEASMLLHEAVVAMRHGLGVDAVADTVHAHPTLNKVVEAAFQDVSLESG